MNLDVVLSTSDRTVGFVHVSKFEGTRTTVDLKFLKQAIKTLEDFAEKGLTPPKLTIGIEESEKEEGMLIFFLDKKGKTGIAIAPLSEEAAD